MRRRAPRPLGVALDGLTRELAPVSPLARVQGCWARVVGDAVAREAEPVGERAGVLTVACRSSTWAQELELLSTELLSRVNRALGGEPGAPQLIKLKAVVQSGHARDARRSPNARG